MNAAELALLADPKALLAYASSLINMIVSGEVSPDGVVDTQLAAHTAHGAPAEAPAQPAAPVESERITVRHLGNNPVVPVDPDGAGPKTRIEHGFDGNDTDASTENDSTIIQSARELARAEGLNEQQTEELMKKIAADKDRFIAASKVDGYSSEGVTDTKIQKGDYGMATGSGPQKVTLDLETPQDAVTKTYTLSDGTKVEYTLPDACGNSTIKVTPPVPVVAEAPSVVTPAPEAVCPPEGRTVSRDLYVGTKGEPDAIGYPKAKPDEVVPVVKIVDMPKDSVWQDKNGDDDMLCEDSNSKLGVGYDEGEIFPGITREQIDADVKAFRDAGYKGPAIFYEVTDCDGKRYVACWDIKKEEWGVAYPDDARGNPIKVPGEPGNVYATLTGKDLDLYLRGSDRTTVVVK